MKIYEIIAENKQVDEAGASLITRGLSKLFGPAAEVGANLIGKGPKARAIEKAAEYIATRGEIKNAKHLASVIGDAKYATDDVLKAANKEASIFIRNSKFAANMKGIGDTAKVVKSWGGMAIRAGLTGAYYYMFWDPLSLYLDNIQAAESYLTASDPKDRWTQEEFEAYRRREMSALIGKWALLWGTGKLVKIPFGVVSKIFGGASSKVGGALLTLQPGAQAFFMSWVNEPENAKDIATFMAKPLMSYAVGGIGVTAENKIRAIIPFAKEYAEQHPNIDVEDEQADGTTLSDTKSDAEQGTKPDASADKKPTDKPADTKADAKPAKKDPTEWVYSSPGMVKNIKTGEVDYAID